MECSDNDIHCAIHRSCCLLKIGLGVKWQFILEMQNIVPDVHTNFHSVLPRFSGNTNCIVFYESFLIFKKKCWGLAGVNKMFQAQVWYSDVRSLKEIVPGRASMKRCKWFTLK